MCCTCPLLSHTLVFIALSSLAPSQSHVLSHMTHSSGTFPHSRRSRIHVRLMLQCVQDKLVTILQQTHTVTNTQLVPYITEVANWACIFTLTTTTHGKQKELERLQYKKSEKQQTHKKKQDTFPRATYSTSKPQPKPLPVHKKASWPSTTPPENLPDINQVPD